MLRTAKKRKTTTLTSVFHHEAFRKDGELLLRFDDLFSFGDGATLSRFPGNTSNMFTVKQPGPSRVAVRVCT